jgi:hypothetical protein
MCIVEFVAYGFVLLWSQTLKRAPKDGEKERRQIEMTVINTKRKVLFDLNV